MSLELKGTLKVIGATEQVTEKFSKRLFVIEVPGKYTNIVALQFVNDKTDLLDTYEVGQEVRVHFDVRSREWNGKYFTELTAWGIAKEGVQHTETAPKKEPESVDDLPF